MHTFFWAPRGEIPQEIEVYTKEADVRLYLVVPLLECV